MSQAIVEANQEAGNAKLELATVKAGQQLREMNIELQTKLEASRILLMTGGGHASFSAPAPGPPATPGDQETLQAPTPHNLFDKFFTGSSATVMQPVQPEM